MRAIVLLLYAASLGGAPPAPRREMLRIPISVQAEAGKPAAALAREALSVKVNGVAVQPAGLLAPGDDLVLLVVTDMAGDVTLADLAKRALNERLAQLPSNALAGLLRAQDGLRVLVDPTADRAALKAAVDALPVSGKAGLLETVQTAAALGDSILAKAGVRLAVLFITDSDVGNYREDFTNPTINWTDSGDISRRFRDGLVREKISKLDASLAAVETPIFILHLAYRTDTLNQAYQTGLMTLAATTGGSSYFCRSQTEIPDAMGKAFEAITSQYSLTVALPKALPKVVDVTLGSPGHTLSWRSRFALKGN
jgi:hypothetical protein